MKGLRLYIPPFAPDQSGATGVLSMLCGLIVILDAGGCAGNVCGFDEPRWFDSRSAIFSAGLRDMDAILGRDDRLVEKIKKACDKIHAKFIAVIGTPVPAVIGTDYRAVGRMLEKQTGLPVIMIDTDGTGLYDEGEKKAFLALSDLLFRKDETGAKEKESVGVLGITPLNFNKDFSPALLEKISQSLKAGKEACELRLIGTGEESFYSDPVSRILVASPSGLAAAKKLKKKYDIPYEIYFDPSWILDKDALAGLVKEIRPKRILVVHQQFAALAIRDFLSTLTDAGIDVGSFFGMEKSLMREGDLHFKEEDDWVKAAGSSYDLILADEFLKRASRHFEGSWFDLPHFALSGR